MIFCACWLHFIFARSAHQCYTENYLFKEEKNENTSTAAKLTNFRWLFEIEFKRI